ncbi:MAG TPA: trypsin-like peptidase domain-containing protein [Thermoanaerobaculia bacterium]|nr:trypsin-like peptidase domain-containing protein [Thermoanaerobaculia bacterium]
MLNSRVSFAPPSLLLLALALAVMGCRTDGEHLEPVQKMAYRVKPAVVRVSAYATAQFDCSASGIRALGATLERMKLLAGETAFPSEPLNVETGAGGSGSGFIIHPSGYILTNGHVVAPTRDPAALERELLRNGAIALLMEIVPLDTLRALARGGDLEALIARLVKEGSLSGVSIHDEVVLSNGDRARFAVERYSPSLAEKGQDLALLKIDRRNLPTLALGDSEQVRIQESIWIAGYPSVASSGDEVIGGWLSQESDLEATFNPGTITAIRRDRSNTPVLQTDAPAYRGNSGGPAVNRDGMVIGIPTWGHTEEQVRFLVPINVAREFVAGAGVPINIAGKFNELYREALDEAAAGDWSGAREHLTSADALFPGSPDVARFLAEADQARRTEPFWRRTRVLIPVTAASLILLGAAGLLARHQRSRPSFPIPQDGGERTILPSSRTERPGEWGRAGQAEIRDRLGRFTILNGTCAGQRLNLAGSGIRIGRESSVCEIVLDNPKVSRLHAEVVRFDGKVLLIDRDSSNGTYVNDRKIDRRYLRDGDIIYFGGRNAVAVAFHV